MTSEQRATWKLTGELPTSTDNTPTSETPTPASSPAEPAAQAASTDASPSPASEPGTPAAAKGADARKAQLSAEIQDLLRQRNELRRELSAPPAPRTPDAKPAVTSPAPVRTPPQDTEPREDDPRFAGDYGLYLEERAVYRVRKELSEQQAEARRQQDEFAITKAFDDRVKKAREKYPDYDAKALGVTSIRENSPIDIWIMDPTSNGAEVLYHLQTHPGEFARIDALPVAQQLRELAKLELTFEAPAAVPVKTVTDAPPPPNFLGRQAAAPADEVVEAVKRRDFRSYFNAQNARELASGK